MRPLFSSFYDGTLFFPAMPCVSPNAFAFPLILVTFYGSVSLPQCVAPTSAPLPVGGFFFHAIGDSPSFYRATAHFSFFLSRGEIVPGAAPFSPSAFFFFPALETNGKPLFFSPATPLLRAEMKIWRLAPRIDIGQPLFWFKQIPFPLCGERNPPL